MLSSFLPGLWVGCPLPSPCPLLLGRSQSPSFLSLPERVAPAAECGLLALLQAWEGPYCSSSGVGDECASVLRCFHDFHVHGVGEGWASHHWPPVFSLTASLCYNPRSTHCTCPERPTRWFLTCSQNCAATILVAFRIVHHHHQKASPCNLLCLDLPVLDTSHKWEWPPV